MSWTLTRTSPVAAPGMRYWPLGLVWACRVVPTTVTVAPSRGEALAESVTVPRMVPVWACRGASGKGNAMTANSAARTHQVRFIALPPVGTEHASGTKGRLYRSWGCRYCRVARDAYGGR